jgi:Flp pilus assembly protein TadD/predicted  nucleic acid-binding Zn-ribbon protein
LRDVSKSATFAIFLRTSPMRTSTFSLLALLGLAATPAFAETNEASDKFLGAYLSFQKAEKAEGAGNPRAAITAYNQTVDALDELSAHWPKWNPPIVKHRREKAVEALERLEAKPAPAPERNAAVPSVPSVQTDLLPPVVEGTNPLPDSFPKAPVESPRTSSRRSSSGDPIQEIQTRIDSLQQDLNSTRDRLEKVAQEKAEMTKKYENAMKQAKDATERMDVLKRRADLAEQKLNEAEKAGTGASEQAVALRAELASLKKEHRKLQIERDAELELNEQYASRVGATRTKLNEVTAERDAARKENAEVPKKMADMQKQIDQVLKEKSELESKLGKVQEQLTKVTTERDDAVQQVVKMKEANKNLEKLATENATLLAKLNDAEKQIAQLKADGVEKDKTIAALNKDLTSTRKQLADVQKESAAFQTEMTKLTQQLETQNKDLLQGKSDSSATAAERKKMVEENELLRGIILRQQKEQARRDRMKKMVLEQLAKLDVNSKAIKDQINVLGSPIVKLSERERKLFKNPQLSISETDITFVAPDASKPAESAENTDAKPAEAPAKDANTAAAAPAEPTLPKSDGKTAPASELAIADAPNPFPDLPVGEKTELASAKTAVDKLPAAEAMRKADEAEAALKPATETMPPLGKSTAVTPAMPAEIADLAREAKEQFERSNYREAEKIYLKAQTKAPNNVYILSNLGVTQFRQQKYKLAEESFKKAIANAPEDDFSHCTLGIVHYQKGEYDNAIQSLTRALAINPKNATAHNYLGITASQKGWQEAAQKHLETAVAFDPNYADAHFNLAVVFASQSPPNKEAARQHYKRALELGAAPDSTLENLIK